MWQSILNFFISILGVIVFIFATSITWKVFHHFWSLAEAVHESNFSYFIKRLGASLAVGFISMALVVGGLTPNKDTNSGTPQTYPEADSPNDDEGNYSEEPPRASVQVPPPDVVTDIPMETNTTAISNATDNSAPPAAPPAPVARTSAKIGRMPSSEDYYPAPSKRAGEQGAVTIKVCVDAKGKLIGDPSVVTSSGFDRLDEGAVKLARAGRYQPGMSGGQTEDESCVLFRVKFEIK